MVKGIHFVHRAVKKYYLVSEKSGKYIFFPMVRDPVSKNSTSTP